ncbi:osmoprotectant transport system permease protein [Microbacterium halimionae]|uniref:Osmoprotectant transport system permease protein n=1 Tax=Microbacterium halimionae TaxID=1526413 RepID=A0A7W3JMY4_9MICO|nr:ABC transporter permease subunit [Microbacterium halimionae]MBA8815783.1 osmoprotectant transport system permease protein [Microbacterium halimionae]NII95829.1 osmoprotectant transport system permease protein [Microbacterium halimionae]
MNYLLEALAWIFSPDRFSGTVSLPAALGQQLGYTAAAIVIASLIAVPLGWLIGHTGRGREVAVAVSGAARAIPSFGLLVLLVLVLGVVKKPEAAIITFVVLAIPSILAGAYSGFEAVDRRTVDSARALGMTEWQILWRVEVPLGLPLLVGGLRSATLQVVATVTIAAYVMPVGLGQYIITGLQLRQLDVLIGGAILVAVLALVLDGLFALAQRLVVPAGVSAAERVSSGKPPRQVRKRAMSTSS